MSEKPKYDCVRNRDLVWRVHDGSNFISTYKAFELLNTQSATIARLEAENAELRALIKRRPPNTCCNLEMIADDGQWNSFGEVTEQAKLDAKMLLEIIQGEEVSGAAEGGPIPSSADLGLGVRE